MRLARSWDRQLGLASHCQEGMVGAIHEFLLILGQSRKVLDPSKKWDTEAETLDPQL